MRGQAYFWPDNSSVKWRIVAFSSVKVYPVPKCGQAEFEPPGSDSVSEKDIVNKAGFEP